MQQLRQGKMLQKINISSCSALQVYGGASAGVQPEHLQRRGAAGSCKMIKKVSMSNCTALQVKMMQKVSISSCSALQL